MSRLWNGPDCATGGLRAEGLKEVDLGPGGRRQHRRPAAAVAWVRFRTARLEERKNGAGRGQGTFADLESRSTDLGRSRRICIAGGEVRGEIA